MFSRSYLFQLFFRSDCGFNHVTCTCLMQNFTVKQMVFISECRNKCSQVMNHFIKVCEGFVCFFTES